MSEKIICPIRLWAATYPGAPAVRDGDLSLTYEQLSALVTQAQVLLIKKGVAAGDTVAVLAPNSVRSVILFWAAFRLGCVLVPLNVRLTPDDWRRCLDAVEYRLLIYGDEYHTFAESMERSLPLNEIPTEYRREKGFIPPDLFSLERPAVIIFTSGSSGAPRGARLSWSNLFYSARGTQSVVMLNPEHAWLAVLPLYHVGGLMILMRAAQAAATVDIASSFDADATIEAVTEGRVSHMSIVPTMLRKLLDHPGAATLKKAKAIICGGEAFDTALQKGVTETGLPVLTTYGMTETASMVTLLSPKDSPARLSSCGKVLPHGKIYIMDDGLIRVQGAVVFDGYIDSDEPVVSPEGWFDTGDIGYMDDEGFLYVTGRADAMIVSGGENIHLDAIESALAALPEIRLAAVLSRPDAEWGRRPVAFVEAEAATDEEYLRGQLGNVLSRIMIPDRIIVIETMPTTAIGKPDRRRLRELYPKYLT